MTVDRCTGCQHPASSDAGEWSACAPQCTHAGPIRCRHHGEVEWERWTAEDLRLPTLPQTYRFAEVQAPRPVGEDGLCAVCREESVAVEPVAR